MSAIMDNLPELIISILTIFAFIVWVCGIIFLKVNIKGLAVIIIALGIVNWIFFIWMATKVESKIMADYRKCS